MGAHSSDLFSVHRTTYLLNQCQCIFEFLFKQPQQKTSSVYSMRYLQFLTVTICFLWFERPSLKLRIPSCSISSNDVLEAAGDTQEGEAFTTASFTRRATAVARIFLHLRSSHRKLRQNERFPQLDKSEFCRILYFIKCSANFYSWKITSEYWMNIRVFWKGFTRNRLYKESYLEILNKAA